LSANDFFIGQGLGAVVPAAGAGLLDVDFLASSNASGRFGIYALEGAALTQWTDYNATTQFFTDVPNGTAMDRIGDVVVGATVPEPSALVMAGIAMVIGLGVAVGRRCVGARA